MNGRVKIDRLVYLNNIYAIDGQISLSGALNNLLIYHWYCQQEPTVTVSIWHYFTFHSALVRLQPESHSRHHNSRKMRTDWKLSKPGLQRWSQVGEHTPQGKTEGVINFLCGERLLRGDVITIFQYLKNIYMKTETPSKGLMWRRQAVGTSCTGKVDIRNNFFFIENTR